jgi:PPP family 3-phenylpropionic acid transporter
MCGSVRSGPYREPRQAARRTIGSVGTGPLTHTRSVTSRRLSAIYAMQGIAFGLLMPFPVPLLSERGLGAAHIGLILSVAGVAALLAYPVWGAIADGWLGRVRTIAIASLTAAAGGVWILLAESDPVVLTMALSLAMVGAMAWGPLIDALTLGVLGDGSAGYGRIRVWASVGWAASAMAGGWLWVQVGPEPVFFSFVVGSVLVAALVLLPTGESSAAADARDAAPHPSLRSWLPLLLAPVMVGFLIGLLLTSMGEHASWRFISLRILDQGGGVFLVGLAASLPALVEIPVFASSRRLTARLGLRAVFVSGAIVAAVLMALVAVAPEPWMITGLRTLEGASYALRYMAMVMIVGALLPRHLYAMGQSVAWFVYAGIAPIVADAAGGLIYDVLGAPALFAVVTVSFALGAAVVWLVLRGPEFGPQRDTAVSAEVPPPPPPA